MTEAKLTGGLVNYYLTRVDHPQREDQPPYRPECDDIIEALELNPDEANIFKEIWRSANARKHNGKPGHTALYGAEKIVHCAGRILRRVKRQSNVSTSSQILDATRIQTAIGTSLITSVKQRQEEAMLRNNIAATMSGVIPG